MITEDVAARLAQEFEADDAAFDSVETTFPRQAVGNHSVEKVLVAYYVSADSRTPTRAQRRPHCLGNRLGGSRNRHPHESPSVSSQDDASMGHEYVTRSCEPVGRCPGSLPCASVVATDLDG